MIPIYRKASTGAAWLSSARAVRCWVKSRNERNPYPLLPRKGISEETASDELEEGGDDVKSSWPYVQGDTRATMAATEGRNTARWSQSLKAVSVGIGVCNSTP